MWLCACCLALALSACTSPGPVETEAPAAAPELDIRLLAKWWSEDQMEGLNLDNQPPKTQTIELLVWDPSDPVGTPHPAEFDVVIDIANVGSVQRAMVEVRERWKVGPISDPGSARWQDWQTVGTPVAVTWVNSDNASSAVHRVQLQDTLDTLFQTSRWAFGYQADAKVSLDTESTVGTASSRTLSIQAGD